MNGSFTEWLLSKKLCLRRWRLQRGVRRTKSARGVFYGRRLLLFLMSGQEIPIAVEERLPVIFVVLNDHAYGMIKHAHRLAGTEPVEFAIPPVDFCQMAKAAGAEEYTIRHPRDFEQLDYLAFCSRNGPTLLEVFIDPEKAPPLGMV